MDKYLQAEFDGITDEDFIRFLADSVPEVSYWRSRELKTVYKLSLHAPAFNLGFITAERLVEVQMVPFLKMASKINEVAHSTSATDSSTSRSAVMLSMIQ